MNTAVDFRAMVANATAAVMDHRDADLLANLARLTDLRDQAEIARRRSSTAYNRVLGLTCREAVALEAMVAATPAMTSEGRRAKALHCLRDADPNAPCGGFTGFNASVFSALWDIVQAGGL